MSDLTYVVDIDLRLKNGGLQSGLGSIGGKVAGLDGDLSRLAKDYHDSLVKVGNEFKSLGGKAADAFTGSVEAIAGKVAQLGKLGAVAGVGLVTYGVVGLNNELEKTQISLAAIFNANGQAANMGAGMRTASDMMGKLRRDAAELPGEFSDLVGIFRTAAVPAFKMGMDPEQLRAMSAKVMAVGAVSGLSQDMVARQFAMLLEGRAGSRNVLGMRLAGLGGAEGKAFNAKSNEDRIKYLSAALDKFAPAIAVYKASFDGLSSTLIDNLKLFGGTATAPLFAKVKNTLADINLWFDNNQDKVSRWAGKLGDFLGEAFDTGKQFILDWWPAISTFAENAYNRIVSIWKDAGPYVKQIGESIKGFLENPESLDKIANVLKLYAAVKVGGGAADTFGGVAKGGLDAFLAYKMLGLGGAGAGAAGAAGGGGGAGAAAAGVAGGGFFAAAGTAIGGLTAAVGLAGSQIAAFTEGTGESSGALGKLAMAGYGLLNPIGLAGSYLAGLAYGADEASVAVKAHAGSLNAGNVAATEWVTGVAAMIGASGSASDALAILTGAAQGAGQALSNIGGFMKSAGGAAVGVLDKVFLAMRKSADPAGGRLGGGGGGGTMKVEITISSNQAPGQIARQVAYELSHLARHRRTSSGVRNFSAVL